MMEIWKKVARKWEREKIKSLQTFQHLLNVLQSNLEKIMWKNSNDLDVVALRKCDQLLLELVKFFF